MLALLPHQQECVDAFIAHKGRMLLHADCGTGKTAVALTLASMAASKNLGHILYLCPAIVKHQVALEASRFTTTPVVVIEGDRRVRNALYSTHRASQPTIFVINYELLIIDYAVLMHIPLCLIIADECQKVASPAAKSTKLLKKLSAPFRLAMSGTPAPNALHDFWSMTDWLSPGILGKSFYEFRNAFCKTHPFIKQKIVGYYDEQRLRAVFDSFTHRVRSRDVLHDLPPLTERVYFADMRPEEKRRYSTLKNDLILELEEAGRKLTIPNAIALLTRLRQITDCPRVLELDDESSKEKLLHDLLALYLEDKTNKIIIFAEYATVIAEISKRYFACASVITGQTSANERRRIVDIFTDPSSDTRLLFATSAAEAGLNLQAANKVIHYSMKWTASGMMQRSGRAHRKGQLRPVESVILLTRSTVDEYMKKLCDEKAKLNAEDLIKVLKMV